MPIAVLRPYKIVVCKPGETISTGFDVTNFCQGSGGGFLSLTSEPIDTDGNSYKSGRLTLAVPPYDDRFNPWVERDRWAIGNFVLAQIQGSDGEYHAPPIDHLYILSRPRPPYPGNWLLEIELGCKLRLDSQSPPPASLPNSGSRGELVSALTGVQIPLNYAGKSLSNYQPQLGQGAIGAAGELAIGARSVLSQTPTGGIEAIAINLSPQEALFVHTVGVDDAGEFEPIQSPLRTANEIRVVSPVSNVEEGGSGPGSGAGGGAGGTGGSGSGTGPGGSSGAGGGFGSNEGPTSGSRITPIRMPANAVDPEAGGGVVTVGHDQVRWQWQGKSRYQETRISTRARGLLWDDSIIEAIDAVRGVTTIQMGKFAQVNAEIIEELQVYEQGTSGRLLLKDVRIVKATGTVLGDVIKRSASLFVNSTNPALGFPIEAERTITTYSYARPDGSDAQGQTRSIHTTTWKTIGEIAGPATDWTTEFQSAPSMLAHARLLHPTEIIRQDWHPRGGGRWEEVTKILRSAQVRQGSPIKAYLALADQSPPPKVGGGGETQPPPAERRLGDRGVDTDKIDRARNPDNPFELEPFEGFVEFDGAPRTDTIEINHLESNAHAQAIALLLARIDRGREEGFRIVRPYSDEWRNWKLFSRIDAVYSGVRYCGITDLLNITLSGNSAIVLADCMIMGRTPAPTSSAIVPINLPSIPAAISVFIDIEWQFFEAGLQAKQINGDAEPDLIIDTEFELLPPSITANFDLMVEAELEFIAPPPAQGLGNPAVWWGFENGSLVDSVAGITLTGGTAQTVPGAIGGGVSFGSSIWSANQNAAENSAIAFGNQNWAVSFQLKPASTSQIEISELLSVLSPAVNWWEDPVREWRIGYFQNFTGTGEVDIDFTVELYEGSFLLLSRDYSLLLEESTLTQTWIEFTLEFQNNPRKIRVKAHTNPIVETDVPAEINAPADARLFLRSSNDLHWDELKIYKPT